jgi:AhpD family alkylhydroperoxidase
MLLQTNTTDEANPMSPTKKRVNKTRTRRGKAADKKPKSTFGGYRKRTITAREFVTSLFSLAGEAPTIYQIWGKHELDPGFREELMFAVAKLNDCRYCSWGHHEWAHLAGVPEEELAQIEQMDPEAFDRRKWVALSYVRAFVSAKFGSVPRELRKEMRENYSAHEIKEIELVVRIMDVGNRGANTWDAMLSRLKGNPAADSNILDEAVLSTAFLAIAPVAIAYLAHASKRSYREMAGSLIDYVKHYEERNSEEQVAAP